MREICDHGLEEVLNASHWNICLCNLQYFSCDLSVSSICVNVDNCIFHFLSKVLVFCIKYSLEKQFCLYDFCNTLFINFVSINLLGYKMLFFLSHAHEKRILVFDQFLMSFMRVYLYMLPAAICLYSFCIHGIFFSTCM